MLPPLTSLLCEIDCNIENKQQARMETSKNLLSQLNSEYLTCTVCMEIFAEPKVLSCQHSFCKTCLELCEKSEQGVYVICPLCRQNTLLGFKGVHGLRNNFILSNMIAMLEEWRKSRNVQVHGQRIGDEQDKMCQSCPETEITMATYQCIDCLEHLCADCAAFHSRTKLTKDHQVKSVQEIESGKHSNKIHYEEMSRCKEHNFMKLDHHCKECDILACRDCAIEAHQGHHLIKTEQAIVSVKQEIVDMQENINMELQKSEDTLEELLQTKQDQENKMKELQQEVNDAAQYFINRINEQRNRFLTDIESNINPKLTSIERTQSQLKHVVADYNNLTKISQCVSQDNIPKELLDLRKKMVEHLAAGRQTLIELQKETKTQTTNENAIRFNYGEVTDLTLKAMGYIEIITAQAHKSEEEEVSVIECGDETPDDEKLLMRTCESQALSKFKMLEVPNATNHTLNEISERECEQNELSPRESLYANFSKNQNLFAKDDMMIKMRPTIARRPSDARSPVPSPRQRSKSTVPPVTLPRPIKMPKPMLSVKPNIKKTPDCYRLTRIKGTVPVPDQKPTVNPGVPTITVKPVPQRAAPTPPKVPPPSLPIKNSMPTSMGSPTAHKRSQSHDPLMSRIKKCIAPSPPVKLASSFSGIIGVKREFIGPPTDVVITENNIIVLDGDGGNLVVFNKSRKHIKTNELSDAKLGKHVPLAMQLGIKKHLFILFKTFVGRYTVEGVVRLTFGHGDLIEARDLAINSFGHIVVLDGGKCDIFVFEPDGTKLMKFGGFKEQGNLKYPRFVHVTSTDSILVSDHNSCSVNCYEKSGKFSFTFGSKGSAEGQMLGPSGITTTKINKAEVILVSDEGNNRVSVFDCRGRFMSHLIHNEIRLQSPQSINASGNTLVLTQRNCFQCPIFDLQ